MKAENIQREINDYVDIQKGVNKAFAQQYAEQFKVLMLAEVALQLAKLVEHFELVDNAVFGSGRGNEKKKETQVPEAKSRP